MQSIDELVVHPLKAARDEVAWNDQLEAVLATWAGLRVALAEAGIRELGPLTIEEAARQVADLPLTLLPEPAHGAAVFSIDLLAWLAEQTFAAIRRRAPLDIDALQACIHDVAMVELCWLTLVGDERPVPAVAEAAAWEAYSRARPLRALLLRVGFAREGMPTETADEASERGLAMLERVSGAWTDGDRAAVNAARLPDVLSQA